MTVSPIKFLLKRIPADYGWEDENIVRIGEGRDIAAYAAGDFKGPCLVFCHGNGETAVSEKYWFEKLVEAGVSVVCPDYRGYGLTDGRLSEEGCYEAAHAAYSYLTGRRCVRPSNVYVLGYSIGSAVAVELAASERIGGLILQAPFLNGEVLLRFWANKPDGDVPDCVFDAGREILGGVFPTETRLTRVSVPVLVIHGTADGIVPFAQGRRVFELLPSENKKFIPVENGGHNTFQYIMGDDYVRTLAGFMGLAAPVATKDGGTLKQGGENGVASDLRSLWAAYHRTFLELEEDPLSRKAVVDDVDNCLHAPLSDPDFVLYGGPRFEARLYGVRTYDAMQEIKREMEKRRRRFTLLLVFVLTPILWWLAWWLGQRG